MRRLIPPIIGTGAFMATYLLTRPHSDAAGEAAAAFASPRWVFTHCCGMAALASAARLAVRAHDVLPTRLTALARWSALAGIVLVLPYFGAETFALHALGERAVAGHDAALEVVAPIREGGVQMTMFGTGLALLGVSGLATAHAVRAAVRPGWALWPLGASIAFVLPQFFLPPAGRMAFGVGVLVAALVAARAVWTSPSSAGVLGVSEASRHADERSAPSTEYSR